MINKIFKTFLVLTFISGTLVYAQEEVTETTEPESVEESTYSTVNATEQSFYQDGDMLYSTSKTKFQISARDENTDVEYIEYKVDDGTFERYVEPFSITGDGVHHIVYYAVDTVGNKEPDSTLTVVIDDTAPQVTLSNTPTPYKANGNLYVSDSSEIVFASSDNLCGVKAIRYSVNEGAMQDYNGAITTSTSGAFTLKYMAEDKLGNATAMEEYSVIVDNSAPVLKIEPVVPLKTVNDVFYAKKGAGFRIEATDEESGIEKILVKIDEEGEFVPATSEIFFDTAGAHVIEAKAIDNVGNESNTERFEFFLDNQVPASVITPISGN